METELGDGADVITLSQELGIECSNLDDIMTEKLRQALKTQCELENVPMQTWLRKTFRGTRGDRYQGCKG